MASIGPNNPTSAVNDIEVGEAWVNPTFCFSSNDQRAQVSVESAQPPDYDPTIIDSYGLYVSGFGFAIPSGSTIDGIVVEVEKSVSATTSFSVTENTAKLVKVGSAVGSNKASNAGYGSTTDSYDTYGSSSDLWGTTWTPSEVNDSSFGFVLSLSCVNSHLSLNRSARIDHIRITVHYTLGSGDAAGQNMLAVF